MEHRAASRKARVIEGREAPGRLAHEAGNARSFALIARNAETHAVGLGSARAPNHHSLDFRRIRCHMALKLRLLRE